jgi:PiT family inorganic phosphate transporter
VGALIGFGVVGLGVDAINWGEVGRIMASWIVSPLLGGIIAYGLAQSLRVLILEAERPLEAAKKYGPIYVFLMGVLIALMTVWKGLKQLDIDLTTLEAVGIAIGVGLFTAFVGRVLIRRVEVDPEAEEEFHFAGVERVFAPLCVFTACAMAFAHGSNDVANGIGPLAAVVSVATSGDVAQDSALPLWILVIGGLGIVLGLVTLGYRVMQTIGTKITELTPSRGFCAELAAATTVVIATRMGLPVSTTHIIVGAVLGVGFARGIAAIDLRVVTRIVTSWIVTLPIGAGLAAMFFLMFRAILS